MGQYQHRTYRTISMIRAGLVSIIYNKTGALSLKDVDPAASMTLMSADIERIVQGFQTMHEIWSNAIEVGVAIYLLERQLGVACVVPVAVSIREFLFRPAPSRPHVPTLPVGDHIYMRCVRLTTPSVDSVPRRLHRRYELHHVAAGDVVGGD